MTSFENKMNSLIEEKYYPLDEGDESVSEPPILLQYWHAVLRNRWLLAGIVLIAAIVGLVSTLLMTPEFTATSRVDISRQQQNVTEVESVEAADAGLEQEFYQTQYSLLEARSLAERVARQLRLVENEAFLSEDAGSALGTREIGRSSGRRTAEAQVVNTLLENIEIVPIRGSSLVDISYTSSNPTLAMQVSNTWSQQFIEASMDRRFASTVDARKFLQERLQSLRAQLEDSERNLVNYASDKGIVTLGQTEGPDGRMQGGRTLAASDLEALNAELAEATAQLIQAESEARVRGTTQGSVDNAGISQLRQRRAEAQSEYAKLMVQFEPGYPAARALQEQIRALDAAIRQEEGRVSAARETRLREATLRVQELRSRVTQLKAELDGEQRDNIQLNIYQRDTDTNRQLYDALLQRFKEIGVAGVGANNIAIVDTAQLPVEPSSPNLMLNLLVALIAGLVVAAGVIFVREQVDEGLRDPTQVRRDLQVPFLGSIPDVEGVDTVAELRDAKSTLSEAYLSVRSNLAFSTSRGVPRSFIVTSTRPAEGKSTTSLALATVLGRTGKKVILIDADMRYPSVHEFLGMKNVAGLSNYLSGSSDLAALVHDTDLKNLDVMSSGPTPPSAAELLSSERMKQLIVSLLHNYDHVVIDAPPILGLADAPLLSGAVEGCVFVAEAEGVAVRGIRASLARLRSVQANLFGLVLTKLHEKQAGYGYGYGFGYGYGPEAEDVART